ncbi:uncharacterized protein LOC135829999 isoform X2 [Sycon ciliatum]|eukprot:scpid37083/ scgid25957/ Polycystin-2; Polycystic kidney disease 2 protein homolog
MDTPDVEPGSGEGGAAAAAASSAATVTQMVSGVVRRVTNPTKRDVIVLVVRLVVVFVVIPGGLAAVGATVETVIYSDLNRPNFNDVYFVYSALIAAPLILLRWYWPWPDHNLKLELFYFCLFSIGFLLAIILSTVAGAEAFHVGSHVRQVFNGPGNLYMDIRSESDIHAWLGDALGSIYGRDADDAGVSMFERNLGGRVFLLGLIRLVQFRSPRTTCSQSVRTLLFGSSVCYESRSTTSKQDTEPYTSLQYNYSDIPYRSLSGRKIFASEINLKGQLHSYPLSGHWVVFSPDFSLDNVSTMLNAMKSPEHPWLDHQTSMLMLDATFLTPDTPSPILGRITYMIESTSSGLYIPNSPHVSLNNVDAAEFAREDNERCIPPPVHRNFFVPLFLGVVPTIIYLVFRHILQVRENARKYFSRPFTYSELGWIICVSLSMIFRWRSISFEHCDQALVEQEIYTTGETVQLDWFEFAPIADWWFESRRVLGMAVFLYLFTALKFVVRLPALSGLIRTLQLAGRELASFSLSFAVLFMGFVSMFYIVFSIEAEQFSSLARCVGTLWLGMLGELEITPELWRVKEWALPIIVIFTFISVFVLLTVIVAIISDAHEQAREQKEKAAELRQRVQRAVEWWKKRRGSPANDSVGRRKSRLSIFATSALSKSKTSNGSAGGGGGFANAVTAMRDAGVKKRHVSTITESTAEERNEEVPSNNNSATKQPAVSVVTGRSSSLVGAALKAKAAAAQSKKTTSSPAPVQDATDHDATDKESATIIAARAAAIAFHESTSSSSPDLDRDSGGAGRTNSGVFLINRRDSAASSDAFEMENVKKV